MHGFIRILAARFLAAVLLLSPGATGNAKENAEQHRNPSWTLAAKADSILLRAIDLSGRQRYTAALETFDEVIHLAPRHPAGYLNKAILLEVMSLDFETPVPQPEFSGLLEKAERRADRLISRHPASGEGYYYKGMVHSYLAYYEFRDGDNWLSGLSHGIRAASWLEDCLERDSSAYDAFTGLGTYYFWKSERMSFLNWVPFVEDMREPALRMLEVARKKARYTAAQAVNSLVWIQIHREKYRQAEREALSILKRYPANRLFLWGLASAAEKAGRWKKARTAYERIVASIDNEVRESGYIEIQARAKIALMSHQLGDRERAAKECRWVLGRRNIRLEKFTPNGSERIRRRMQEMAELAEELGIR